jgi:light-regulated signal transduction histidine kinase (bacteriophytochrome)
MRPWRDKALGSGYRSSAAFPVIVHNAVVGIFSLYAPEPFFFSKEEVRLIEDMISEIAYGIEFIEHVSEREKAEERVRTLNAELEERVMLRTAQLDAANKELEAFSYSVSHDLKAPLRAIEGFSKIVVEENAETLDQETRRLLNLVRDNARRMGNLIDDLLSFSRAGRHALSIQRIGMESLVDSVWQELVSREPGRTFEFAVEQLPDAEGDQPLIRQVWANLISNAIKFTSPRDVGIISVGSRAGNESVVYFVKDNGVGFDMQYADKLFGVFQRLHSQGEFQGTGVGLALVHRIIQRHGGKVWAEGAVDGGATFFFSLNSTPDGHDTDNCHAGIVSQGAPAAKQQ